MEHVPKKAQFPKNFENYEINVWFTVDCHGVFCR